MSQAKIAIVDYQLSNLYSVKHACDFVGLNTKITSKNTEISKADAIILPGVGAFGDAMINLNKLGLTKTIKNFVKTGKPMMGVCLGLQLLFTESEEFGQHQGLDLIPGKVIKFPAENDDGEKIKVPHMGWNKIYAKKKDQSNWQGTPLEKNKQEEYMYFVHSYFVKPNDKKVILSLTNYSGLEYCSSLKKNNIFAVQYHPEKSGSAGLKIYKQWSNSI